MRQHTSMRHRVVLFGFAFLTCLSLAVPAAAQQAGKARYVFLFIGDGMGTVHRTAAEVFQSGAVKSDEQVTFKKLTMNSLPVMGLTTTHSYNRKVTDSAAAGTALACGQKTNNGTLSMDPRHSVAYKTIAEIAKARGLKVGIITSESIVGATPAAFYAHQPRRGNYYEISMSLGRTEFDFFAGGAATGAPKKGTKSGLGPVETARANGFTVVTTAEQMRALKAGGGKVWAALKNVDGRSILDCEIERPKGAVSLAELTDKGIELLDNPKGFFMMVEGAMIDKSAHANDAATVIHETLALDRAIDRAMKFYKKHPNDTLIVVTADHETGGMKFTRPEGGNSKMVAVIAAQKMSYLNFTAKVHELRKGKVPFSQALPVVKDAFGLDKLSAVELKRLRDAYTASMDKDGGRKQTKSERRLYGGREPLTTACMHLVGRRAAIGFTTFGHTSAAVSTSAIGIGAKLFAGKYDNTDIFKKMLSVMAGAKKPTTVR